MNDLSDKIPGIAFNKDANNFISIECKQLLPAWRGFQSRQGPYTSVDSEAPSDGTVELHFGTFGHGEKVEILPEQVAAYVYLLQHQQRIQENILQKLLPAYKKFRAEGGYDEELAARIMPPVKNAEGFRPLMGLSIIHFLPIHKDGFAYVGYELGCTWDEEHGLGFMTYKDKVIAAGPADTSFDEYIAEDDAAKKKPWWKF